jgi:nucleotide-binding universal stress UspA family protein
MSMKRSTANVLAALDFSQAAPSVLRVASELTAGLGAKLWLVHVAAPDPDFVGYEAGPRDVRDDRAFELREEHRGLHEWAEDLRGRGLDVTPLLVQGPTVDTLLAEAARLHASYVVLASRGHGPIARALLGSVSDGVVRRASCPVVVVPSGLA